MSLAALIIFKLINVLVDNRDAREIEVEGVDIPQIGVPGYCRGSSTKPQKGPCPGNEWTEIFFNGFRLKEGGNIDEKD